MSFGEHLSREEADEYRQFVTERLGRVYNRVVNHKQYPELTQLLTNKWKFKIDKWINSIAPNKFTPNTQLHHLLHYLDPDTNEKWSIDIDDFEGRLQCVRNAVLTQQKTKSYKTTFRQLTTDNADQVHSAIFELTILYALIKGLPEVDLFSKVGSVGQDVDVAFAISGTKVYCECKTRGYSPPIDSRQGSIDPWLAPRKMMDATLGEKFSKEGQLSVVANDHPTILFTCVGFDAYDHYYTFEIKKRLAQTPCSALIIFDRYICRWFNVFINLSSPRKLTESDLEPIIGCMQEHLAARHNKTHFTAEQASGGNLLDS